MQKQCIGAVYVESTAPYGDNEASYLIWREGNGDAIPASNFDLNPGTPPALSRKKITMYTLRDDDRIKTSIARLKRDHAHHAGKSFHYFPLMECRLISSLRFSIS